ncbi:putative GMC oxidoreductase [Hypoxylon sp. CO27-5]|nr:putative GMC oxidoreductase [Hypoxylon sp. CO27-5]
MAPEGYDFIIVGGGLAGLVLATRLSEDPNASVLVIEAGEEMGNDPRVKTPAMWAALLNSSADWSLKTVPQEGLGGREIQFSIGHLVGGSSALNGLSFGATSKANIDAWTALGNPGWDWSNLIRAVKKSYTLTLPSGEVVGSGPLQVVYPDEDDGWPQLWRDTISALGFRGTNDPFSGEVCGALTVPDTIQPSTRHRSFAGNAYLELATGRPNLTVWSNTVVEKILFDKGHGGVVATGVQYTKDGKTQTVKALKEAIITAGTIHSPKILELSGVGDKPRLESLGIEVVINNPHVGENLQNHPMCSLNFEVIEREGFETMDNLTRGDPDALAAATEAYSRQKGPLARSNANHAAQLPFPGIKSDGNVDSILKILESISPEPPLGNTTAEFAQEHKSFVHSVLRSPTEASACYLSFPGFTRFNVDGTRASARELQGTESYFSIVLLLAHPLSRGSVHIQSPSSSAPPAVDPKYLTHPLDLEVLAHHIKYVETILATEPLASHVKPGGKRNPSAPPSSGSFTDLDNARKYARETSVGAAHYTGTCSMMPRDKGGVVSPQLRVYGCSNLRVCDASIIPITPRTNPQATVYGIAELAAEIIKAGL